MRLEPTLDRIVVRPVEAKVMSEGGIYIPESAQERPNMGEVMGTGPETAIAVGQTVLYRQWNGITVEVDRQVLVILREEDVLAVVGAAAVEGKE